MNTDNDKHINIDIARVREAVETMLSKGTNKALNTVADKMLPGVEKALAKASPEQRNKLADALVQLASHLRDAKLPVATEAPDFIEDRA